MGPLRLPGPRGPSPTTLFPVCLAPSVMLSSGAGGTAAGSVNKATEIPKWETGFGAFRTSGQNLGLPLRRRSGQGPHLAPCWWPRLAPQAWRWGWQEVEGAEPPRVPSAVSTGTVGRCFQEPRPWPRPPWAGLTSARGVTSSRQTPIRVISLPTRFPGLGQEPARKLGREVAGAHWCRGESGGLRRPGRPGPGFLQA